MKPTKAHRIRNVVKPIVGQRMKPPNCQPAMEPLHVCPHMGDSHFIRGQVRDESVPIGQIDRTESNRMGHPQVNNKQTNGTGFRNGN